MARISISLPDALKRRMEETSERNINWSAIATQAFQKTLEIEDMKLVDINQANLARLRNEKVGSLEKQWATGLSFGKTTAAEWSYELLEGVARYADHRLPDQAELPEDADLMNPDGNQLDLMNGFVVSALISDLEAVDVKEEDLIDGITSVQLFGFLHGVRDLYEQI